jgi:hypothetical protein
MRGKRGAAGQRAHALPMQEPGQEAWPRGCSSSGASVLRADHREARVCGMPKPEARRASRRARERRAPLGSGALCLSAVGGSSRRLRDGHRLLIGEVAVLEEADRCGRECHICDGGGPLWVGTRPRWRGRRVRRHGVRGLAISRRGERARGSYRREGEALTRRDVPSRVGACDACSPLCRNRDGERGAAEPSHLAAALDLRSGVGAGLATDEVAALRGCNRWEQRARALVSMSSTRDGCATR